MPDTSHISLSRYYWLILLLFLAPWFYLRLLQVTHSDILWLSEAALRILDGGSMSGDAYDPNPPLSIILYMLPVLAQKYLSIPLHFGVLAQAFAILTASAFALRRILLNFHDVSLDAQRLIVVAFVAYNTIGAGLVFGERDHLIAMVLPPFVLLQLSLTLYPDKKHGFWVWAFSFLASVMILLKPPHGLLPAALLLHRMIHHRNLSPILSDPDGKGLLFATLAYAAIVVAFFPDYVINVLPNMMTYYYPSISDGSLTKNLLLLLGGIVGLTLLTCISKIPTPSKKLTIFFLIAAAASIIPVAVQVKGFYYHYLPALVFLFCGGMLLVHEFLARELSNQRLVAFGTLFIAAKLAYLIAPPVMDYPRHGQYLNLPLPSLIASNPAVQETGSFFIFNDDMSLSHEIAYYSGYHHASRFPSLWFLPGLYYAREHNQSGWPESRDSFAAIIAADLEKDKPGLVLLLSPEHFSDRIDPLEIFSKNPAFQSAWAHYTYVQSTTIAPTDYFGKAATDQPAKTFKVYQRQ